MLYILYQSSVFDDIALLIKKALTHLNPVITTSTRGLDDYYIVLGANDIVGAFPVNYDVFQFEQVNTSGVKNWFDDQSYIDILRKAKRVYDYSHINTLLLKERYNIDATFLPLGYNEAVQFATSTSKNTDVCFFGTMNVRRTKILDELKSANVKLHSSHNIWRDARSKIAQLSKIALNIHYYPNATLETTRLHDLLINGCFIISEHSTDPVLDKMYEDIVIFSDNIVSDTLYWLNTPDDKRHRFVLNARQKYMKMLFSYPEPDVLKPRDDSNAVTDEFPEPDLKKFAAAQTVIHKNGSVSLSMKPDPTLDDMPYASIVTLTRDRHELFELAISNWRRFKYTNDRLEWIVYDDSPTSEIGPLLKGIPHVKYIHNPSVVPLPIADKRNLAVSHASHNIIVHMDDDDYYYPTSVYARVKMLIGSHEVQCVGCNDYGVYNILENYDFRINTDHLSEASMCYYKSFWERQPFAEHGHGESIPFLRNRRSQVLTLPYEFVFIAITHGKNYTGDLRKIQSDRKSHALYNSLDFETQQLLNRLYRKLIKK